MDYFNLLGQIWHCGEDITEVDVKPDGSWRTKKECEFAQWHFPDGSLCGTTDEIISYSETSRQFKLEDNTGHNKYRHTLSPRNQLVEKFENFGPKFITMSSGATGSVRDDEEPSINQNGSGPVEISANSGYEIDSIPHNFDPIIYGTVNRSSSALSGDADIIILSDSDEENIELVTPETLYNTCPVNDIGCSFSTPSGILDSYPKDPALDAGVSSCLGTYNIGNDLGMPHWTFPSGGQAGPGFQLYGTDADVSDAFINLEHTSATCSAPMNGYTLASNSTMNYGGHVPDYSVCHPNNDIHDSLVDNPLAFVGEDPSLQNFLPTQQARVSLQSDLGNRSSIPNGVHTGNRISLRPGRHDEEGGGGAQAKFASRNGLDLRNRFGSNEG